MHRRDAKKSARGGALAASPAMRQCNMAVKFPRNFAWFATGQGKFMGIFCAQAREDIARSGGKMAYEVAGCCAQDHHAGYVLLMCYVPKSEPSRIHN